MKDNNNDFVEALATLAGVLVPVIIRSLGGSSKK